MNLIGHTHIRRHTMHVQHCTALAKSSVIDPRTKCVNAMMTTLTGKPSYRSQHSHQTQNTTRKLLHGNNKPIIALLVYQRYLCGMLFLYCTTLCVCVPIADWLDKLTEAIMQSIYMFYSIEANAPNKVLKNCAYIVKVRVSFKCAIDSTTLTGSYNNKATNTHTYTHTHKHTHLSLNDRDARVSSLRSLPRDLHITQAALIASLNTHQPRAYLSIVYTVN